eukprot:CAMPEP_0170058288 /NCGR_PEP_ID=MMETSP0019_2-20121128/967_1 /TAXON_ID=98059 /ORGANISM="Dinobryon sp., Strain UTEXLB2267" /LENGTH=453 /DNA_ID=CAMNT_0010263191 /DNA_START=730 /DNA_END=2088 /DNA_ORIENTATION=+
MSEVEMEWKKAFRDADIRGEYPSQINEQIVQRIAQSFVHIFQPTAILVGRDMRVSSPSLADSFIHGVILSGCNVIDLGLIDTPGLYFASGSYHEYGVMITASHNPAHYNGLKLVKPGAVPLTNSTGLLQIMNLVEQNIFPSIVSELGLRTERNVSQEYSEYVHSKIHISDTPRPIRCVVDYGNGMASTFAHILKDPRCHLEIKELFPTLDGTFPNRGSDPNQKKNQHAIVSELKNSDYDFGVSFDGDADRVAFFSADGQYINCSIIGAMIAKHILLQYQNHSTEEIIFVDNVFTSRIYPQTVQRYGGHCVKSRVGHAFVKETMRAHNAMFSCENSGHFYFRDNFFADSGVLCFMQIVSLFSKALNEGHTFIDMSREFMVYYQTEEKVVYVPDKTKGLEEVEQVYNKKMPLKMEWFDGLTVIMPGGYWFTVKDSVTEDALKFVVEAEEREVAEM